MISGWQALTLLALFVSSASPASGNDVETITEHYPGGAVLEEREVRRDVSGEATNHGSYKRYFEDGTLAESGRYNKGERSGPWRSFWPGGKKRSRGKYDGDARTGEWKFWLEEGGVDDALTGEYAPGELNFPSGQLRERGEMKDGTRHGPWIYYWESGSRRAAGHFHLGVAEGNWIFYHQDGTPDPLWISGVYREGRRTGPLPQESIPNLPPIDFARLPRLKPNPRLDYEQRKDLEKLLEDYLYDEGETRRDARAQIAELGRASVPSVLNELANLNLTSERDVATGRRVQTELLAPLLWGLTFEWNNSIEPPMVALNKLSILRWFSLLEITLAEPEYFTFDFSDHVTRALEVRQPLSAIHPKLHADGFGRSATNFPFGSRFGPDPLGKDARKAVDSALAWLAAHQDADGRWSATKFMAHDPPGDLTTMPGKVEHDVGVTELAGLKMDTQAYEHGINWLDEVTDVASGRTGYDAVGSFSARVPRINDFMPPENGEAMSAAGLFTRLLLGQGPDENKIIEKNADLCMLRLPEWDPEEYTCDMYYWFYASNAIYQLGGPRWQAWNRALEKALVDSKRQLGAAKGSWDAVGPWGYAGGRVYAAATAALSLLSPRRYDRFLDEDR